MKIPQLGLQGVQAIPKEGSFEQKNISNNAAQLKNHPLSVNPSVPSDVTRVPQLLRSPTLIRDWSHGPITRPSALSPHKEGRGEDEDDDEESGRSDGNSGNGLLPSTTHASRRGSYGDFKSGQSVLFSHMQSEADSFTSQEHKDMTSALEQMSFETAPTREDNNHDPVIAAFRGEGIPDIYLEPDGHPKLSIVTDAGDQAHKSQKQAYSQHAAGTENSARLLSQLVICLAAWLAWLVLLPLRFSWTSQTQHKDKDRQSRLSSQLFLALEQTPKFHQTGFLSKTQLDELINKHSVTRELTRISKSTQSQRQIKKTAEQVCNEVQITLPDGQTRIRSFRKIFALLVLSDTSSMIGRFLEEGVSDLDLPLVRYTPFELRRRMSSDLDRLSDRPSDESLSCFSEFSPTNIVIFEEYQWTMLAPFFCEGTYNHVRHYCLMDNHILPFEHLSVDLLLGVQLHTADGATGRVSMVQIHPEHHNFHDKNRNSKGFAIKSLNSSDKESFTREVNMLHKFTGDGAHNHVVSLLATYEQFKKFHLIFYRAEGDLLELWTIIHPVCTWESAYDNILWMAKQCEGLANGLLKLHEHYTFVNPKTDRQHKGGMTRRASSNDKRPKVTMVQSKHERLRRSTGGHDGMIKRWGRHGDLKPENILWYCDTKDKRGTLKITDFGHSEFKNEWTKSKPRSQIAHTPSYRAPECDLQQKIIRQSADIWSLGCVFLEFVSWMIGGKSLLDKFRCDRLSQDPFLHGVKTDTLFEIVNFNRRGKLEVVVKPAVKNFIDHLHKHQNCTDYLHDILDMIENNMLVVQSNGRLSCNRIWSRLETYRNKCEKDSTYAIMKIPWTFRPRGNPKDELVEVDIENEAQEVIEDNISCLRGHASSEVDSQQQT